MSWGYYEDYYGSEKEIEPTPPAPTKKDFTGLWLLGLGLLGGYMLFSNSDEEKKKEEPKPSLDNLDKAVANKTDIHFNPSFSFPEFREKSSSVEIKKENPVSVEVEKAPAKEVLNVSTLSDLQKWGRVARELYGRSVLPEMKKEDGSPSDIALRAQELGLPVPKTKKEAKLIARQGREALKKFKELKKSGVKKDETISYKVS